MADRDKKDWRELCAAAAEEPDSERLASLVNELIQALDECKQQPLSSGLRQYPDQL